MFVRLTSAALVLLVAAPVAAIGPALADADSSMGCCPTEDEHSERPEITRRCCCDVDRQPPVEPSASPVPAVTLDDDAVAGPGVAVPTGELLAAAPRTLAVPRPRGPPPRPPLLAQKTSFLL